MSGGAFLSTRYKLPRVPKLLSRPGWRKSPGRLFLCPKIRDGKKVQMSFRTRWRKLVRVPDDDVFPNEVEFMIFMLFGCSAIGMAIIIGVAIFRAVTTSGIA